MTCRLFVYIVSSIFFVTGLCAADTNADSVEVKDPTGAMLRSVFVPGWGQFYNGKWLKGTIIAGAEVGLITNAIVLHQYMKAADTEYDKDFYWDNRNLSLWWLGATILYSMADAYVDAHLSDFDAGPELSLQHRVKTMRVTGFKNHMYTVKVTFNMK